MKRSFLSFLLFLLSFTNTQSISIVNLFMPGSSSSLMQSTIDFGFSQPKNNWQMPNNDFGFSRSWSNKNHGPSSSIQKHHHNFYKHCKNWSPQKFADYFIREFKSCGDYIQLRPEFLGCNQPIAIQHTAQLFELTPTAQRTVLQQYHLYANKNFINYVAQFSEAPAFFKELRSQLLNSSAFRKEINSVGRTIPNFAKITDSDCLARHITVKLYDHIFDIRKSMGIHDPTHYASNHVTPAAQRQVANGTKL